MKVQFQFSLENVVFDVEVIMKLTVVIEMMWCWTMDMEADVEDNQEVDKEVDEEVDEISHVGRV